jgi:uncharacterized protein (DUF1697 family)
VALLRGINVGGKNTLPMCDLAAMFVEGGCTDVRTYIQSGNVVFAATPGVVERLADDISRRIAKSFGYRVPVVVRTADELRQVVRGNPFLKSDADARSLHVAFLADLPDPGRIAALDPKRSPGDSFSMRGREIYLCLPNGVAGTKLSNAYFDSALATTSTLRNWRTVLKLLEMTQR